MGERTTEEGMMIIDALIIAVAIIGVIVILATKGDRAKMGNGLQSPPIEVYSQPVDDSCVFPMCIAGRRQITGMYQEPNGHERIGLRSYEQEQAREAASNARTYHPHGQPEHIANWPVKTGVEVEEIE